MLIKQLSDNTGLSYHHCRRLAFVIIQCVTLTTIAHALHQPTAIAQPTQSTESTQPSSRPPHLTNTHLLVESVASHLEGVMSTAQQAATDPNFVGVQMTTCRVNITNPQPNSVYLYQEQALTESLASPYRQRFLQIVPGENDRIQSLTFKPNTPEEWTGLCNQPNRNLSHSNMGEQTCTVSLRVATIGGFVGSTPAGGCAANVRGAISITNVVVLHDRGMDTWDRGLDAEGNRVWGAQDTPYQYRREP
ncbi:MAG: chromophore lyase CpcT/CpeT [Cyanobacteria bacterium J06621_11]